VPTKSSQDDLDRLESLCQLYGIGLVQFDADNKDEPCFELVLRAATGTPDMYYLNENMRKIEGILFA
jgi:hypothetical protein